MGLLSTLREDLDNARSHDPAARGDLENAVVYSGCTPSGPIGWRTGCGRSRPYAASPES